jgi:hypothetical protein
VPTLAYYMYMCHICLAIRQPSTQDNPPPPPYQMADFKENEFSYLMQIKFCPWTLLLEMPCKLLVSLAFLLLLVDSLCCV